MHFISENDLSTVKTSTFPKRLLTQTIYLLLLFPMVDSGMAQTKSIRNSPPLYDALPEKAGMSSERLKRLDAMLEESIESNTIPGAVALVARNGKVVYHKAFGMADNTNGKTMKLNAIFRIASQSKAITATAVMMLWEEGKFRLDDPISKYIPEFKNPQILKSFDGRDSSYVTKPATKEITIRHLLTHTSGLGYGTIDQDVRMQMIYAKAGITDLFTAENVNLGENVRKLAKLPLHHNPGENYVYCEGLDVLGYFIEMVSGQSFDVFLRERVFEPLGMKDTYFYLPQSKAERLVSLQTLDDGKWKPYPVTFYDPQYPIKGAKSFFGGGAGLSSTAKDYAAFLQMYLNKGELNGTRILSRTTVELILEGQTKELFGGPNQDYGLAFAVLEQPAKQRGRGNAGTFFWGGYFNTQYFADPKEQLIGILLKQTRNIATDETGWKFGQIVRQAIDD